MIGLSLLYEEVENPTPLQILSLIFLDIGKPKTMETKLDGKVTFYGHDLVGAEMAMGSAEDWELGNPLRAISILSSETTIR